MLEPSEGSLVEMTVAVAWLLTYGFDAVDWHAACKKFRLLR